MRKIIYIHGFGSSSKSSKATELKKIFKDQIIIPDLLSKPEQDFKILDNIITNNKNPLIVGSSLGGFYGLYFSYKYNLNSILINPLTKIELIKVYIGENNYFYSDKTFKFTQKDYNYLEVLNNQITNKNHLAKIIVLLSEDDETIPYHYAKEYFESPNNTVKLYKNTGHSFTNTAEIVKIIKEFVAK